MNKHIKVKKELILLIKFKFNLGELNRVFVALRHACCQDSCQLGIPCRLKMMEIVELRAMGWRPNLAYTQYYLNRLIDNFEDQKNNYKRIFI